jgi:phage-related tail protein
MKTIAQSAKKEIENAASEAVRVIAHAAEEATRTLAAAAGEALKVSNTKNETNAGDHDLIVELKVRMEDLKNAIRELSDGMAIQVKDHEMRLRALEQNRWTIAGSVAVIVMLIGFAVAYGLKLIH